MIIRHLLIVFLLGTYLDSFSQNNADLVKQLMLIYEDDQKHRVEMEKVAEEYGWNSDQVRAIGDKIIIQDSINVLKVSNIIDQYGWLGPSRIGERGNTTLFLVIQHAEQAVQEKYLPIMRKAVQSGDAQPKHLALLEDRLALKQGKKQIYGSQIGNNPINNTPYVLPLENPESVDERRAEVGLGSLQEYVEHWGMTWSVEKHKKTIAAIEKFKNDR